MPHPTLSSTGKAAIDKYLRETVEGKKVPAAFFGATNAKEEIYFGCGGEKVFGKPEEGGVTPETSEQPRRLVRTLVENADCMQRCSSFP